MKVLYAGAWFLLAAAVVFALVNGIFNVAALVVSSLVALGLVYALALWAVTVNTREVAS